MVMQTVTEPALISGIAYALGDLKPITDLDFLQCDDKKRALYQLAGFEYFAESDLSMRGLAALSATQTLESCGNAADEIDVCLYVAESYDRDETVNSLDVNRLLVDLGLKNAAPMHVSVSNCANIASALRLAASLVEAGSARSVLVVSVDKAPRRFGGRRMFQEMSIKSDISVSCVVSRSAGRGYRLLYLAQHNCADMACTETTDPASYSVPKFKNVRSTARQGCASLSMEPSDFARCITNNYSREVTKMFVSLCGFRSDAGWYRNIPRFAHAVAGDVLINLKDMECSGEFQRGDRLFLMADSITLTSVLCVEAG